MISWVPLALSMTNWTFTVSKPLDDTVRTWFIHSRTVINKPPGGRYKALGGRRQGGVGWFVAGKYSKARQVKSFPRSSWSPLLGPTSVPSCKRTHAKFFYLANDDKFVISSRLLTQNEDIPAKLCSNVNLNSLCPALLFVKLLHEGSSQPGGKKARGKVSVHKYFSAFSQTFLSSATHFFW